MNRSALVVLGCLLAMPGTSRAQSGFPEILVNPNGPPPGMAVPESALPEIPYQPAVPKEPFLPPPQSATPAIPYETTGGIVGGMSYQPTYQYSTVYPPRMEIIDTPALREPTAFDQVFGGHRLWGEADYLFWWFKKAPIAVPLVTTGPIGDPNAGMLDDPATRVLFGVGGFDSVATSGGRIRAGFWIDPCLGVEVAAMLFASPHQTQSFVSDTSGAPILSRPVLVGGVEQAFDIAFPGRWNGAFTVDQTTRLEELELNLVGFGLGDRTLSAEFLAGVRYARLADELDLRQGVRNQIGMLAAGRLIDAGASVSLVDQYRTSNQFFGGQLGARGEWTNGPLSIALNGKIALGVDDQSLTIGGVTHLREANGATSDYVGGLLANASNIGRYEARRFAVVPELGLTVGCWVTPNVRLSVGCSALYWTDVLRAGSQLDRRVNPMYVPLDMTYAPGAPIVRQPPPLLRNDFWAEGLLFGIDIRY